MKVPQKKKRLGWQVFAFIGGQESKGFFDYKGDAEAAYSGLVSLLEAPYDHVDLVRVRYTWQGAPRSGWGSPEVLRFYRGARMDHRGVVHMGKRELGENGIRERKREYRVGNLAEEYGLDAGDLLEGKVRKSRWIEGRST